MTMSKQQPEVNDEDDEVLLYDDDGIFKTNSSTRLSEPATQATTTSKSLCFEILKMVVEITQDQYIQKSGIIEPIVHEVQTVVGNI